MVVRSALEQLNLPYRHLDLGEVELLEPITPEQRQDLKTILKKSSGNINVMSFDSGEGLSEKTTPYDTFVQIIDGAANIVISGISNILSTGQSIVIPAHAANYVTPNGRFKMIVTTIKSGYDL